MNISLLFFASAQDATGTADLAWECSPGSTVEQCAIELATRFPALQELVPRVRFAVNAEFATLSTVLKEGDTLAFLPPMSGG